MATKERACPWTARTLELQPANDNARQFRLFTGTLPFCRVEKAQATRLGPHLAARLAIISPTMTGRALLTSTSTVAPRSFYQDTFPLPTPQSEHNQSGCLLKVDAKALRVTCQIWKQPDKQTQTQDTRHKTRTRTRTQTQTQTQTDNETDERTDNRTERETPHTTSHANKILDKRSHKPMCTLVFTTITVNYHTQSLKP